MDKEEKDREKRREYLRKWYKANKEKHHASSYPSQRARREERVAFIRDLKARPCTDCGVQYPYYIMQFDHISDDKSANVSALITCSKKRLIEEIAKCELVCANCHFERTYQRQSYAALV